MPKGQTNPLVGFESVDRLAAVAALAKKVARTVANVEPDIANQALEAAKRYSSLVPLQAGQAVGPEMGPDKMAAEAK